MRPARSADQGSKVSSKARHGRDLPPFYAERSVADGSSLIAQSSDVEEDGLALALQPDVEPELALGLGHGDERGAPRRLGDGHSTGSAALAVFSSGKYILVTPRSSSPRAKTDTFRCGASMPPSGWAADRLERDDPVGAVRRGRAPAEAAEAVVAARGPAPRGSSGCAKRPSGPACQVSISPSGMMSPAPSYSRPTMVIAPGSALATTNGPSDHGSLIEKYGPTVWEGVIPGT